MIRVDYFVVKLPNHGTRYIGECVGCGIPVLDSTLGSAFVCSNCSAQRCEWCGYLNSEHRGAFNLRRIILGDPERYEIPPGECPDYNRTICLDCMRQIENEPVIILPQGVMHAGDCCGDKNVYDIEAPYLRDDSELMPKLLALDEDGTRHDVIEAVRALPKPWCADTTWRTP
jgi:hypothetical protein